MSQGTHKVVLTSDATRGQDDYIQHYGVLGMKWGIRKDKNQHRSRTIKRRKTYEFKPYKTEYPSAKDIWTDYFSMPFRMISETNKRSRDPVYMRKSNEFISKHYDELLRRFLVISNPTSLATLANELRLSKERKNPEAKNKIKNQIQALRSQNPDITVSQVSRRLGLSRSYVKKLGVM